MAILFMGYRPRGVIATPGYFITDTPWAGVVSNVTWGSRTQGSAQLSGGRWDSTGAQNAEWVNNHWLDTGIHKVGLMYTKDTNQGIHSVQHDGVTVATIDAYAAAGSHNNFTEVTGVAVTGGLIAVKDIMATKNASASAYAGAVVGRSDVRTS